MGLLFGALTLGSALPHLRRGLGCDLDWRWAVVGGVAGASLGALTSAAIFAGAVTEGPHGCARARFDPRRTLRVLRDAPLRVAT